MPASTISPPHARSPAEPVSLEHDVFPRLLRKKLRRVISALPKTGACRPGSSGPMTRTSTPRPKGDPRQVCRSRGHIARSVAVAGRAWSHASHVDSLGLARIPVAVGTAPLRAPSHRTLGGTTTAFAGTHGENPQGELPLLHRATVATCASLAGCMGHRSKANRARFADRDCRGI